MNNDFISSLVRTLVAKLSPQAYLIVGVLLAGLSWFFGNASTWGIALPEWTSQISSAVVFLLFFFRPTSTSDEAVNKAAELRADGDPYAATKIVNQVVEAKAARKGTA